MILISTTLLLVVVLSSYGVLSPGSNQYVHSASSVKVMQSTAKKLFSVSNVPSFFPSMPPSVSPTQHPTVYPSMAPSMNPTISNLPSISPTTSLPTTIAPSHSPSESPTFEPSESPTRNATFKPTTRYPSVRPSIKPTVVPTCLPSKFPILVASLKPTPLPSVSPTINYSPTMAPTLAEPFKMTLIQNLLGINDTIFTLNEANSRVFIRAVVSAVNTSSVNITDITIEDVTSTTSLSNDTIPMLNQSINIEYRIWFESGSIQSSAVTCNSYLLNITAAIKDGTFNSYLHQYSHHSVAMRNTSSTHISSKECSSAKESMRHTIDGPRRFHLSAVGVIIGIIIVVCGCCLLSAIVYSIYRYYKQRLKIREEKHAQYENELDKIITDRKEEEETAL